VDSDNRGDCEDFALSFSEKILEEKTFTKDDVEVHFGYLNDKNNNKKFYHAWVILKDGDDDIFYDSGFSNLETVKKDNKYYIINDENVYFESEEKL
jgi:predicted methyltransferase